jgi:hypothetical protein
MALVAARWPGAGAGDVCRVAETVVRTRSVESAKAAAEISDAKKGGGTKLSDERTLLLVHALWVDAGSQSEPMSMAIPSRRR